MKSRCTVKRNEKVKCHVNRLKAFVEKAETKEVFLGINDVLEDDFSKDVDVHCKLSRPTFAIYKRVMSIAL